MHLIPSDIHFKRTRKIFYPLALLICLFIASCGIKQEATNTTAVTTAYPVFKVATHTATLKTNYPATLQGEQNIEIRPKIDGYIEEIYVDEGSSVKKGQMLFRIRAPQYQQ